MNAGAPEVFSEDDCREEDQAINSEADGHAEGNRVTLTAGALGELLVHVRNARRRGAGGGAAQTVLKLGIHRDIVGRMRVKIDGTKRLKVNVYMRAMQVYARELR